MRPKKGRGIGKARVAVTRSERETFRLARDLARNFRGHEVVLLIGELGAGKTIFAKGIASGLGLKGPGPVCSPSFTLLNVYQARFPIFHFDLYRLEKGAEVEELGLEDCLDRGVVIVEWAEKLPFHLAAIQVVIEKERGDERIVKISPPKKSEKSRGRSQA